MFIIKLEELVKIIPFHVDIKKWIPHLFLLKYTPTSF